MRATLLFHVVCVAQQTSSKFVAFCGRVRNFQVFLNGEKWLAIRHTSILDEHRFQFVSYCSFNMFAVSNKCRLVKISCTFNLLPVKPNCWARLQYLLSKLYLIHISEIQTSVTDIYTTDVRRCTRWVSQASDSKLPTRLNSETTTVVIILKFIFFFFFAKLMNIHSRIQ